VGLRVAAIGLCSLLVLGGLGGARAAYYDDPRDVDVMGPYTQDASGMVFPEAVGTFKLYKGRGCQNCNNTGYRGRVGLFEVMEITDEVRELILSGASALELKRKAVEEGMVSLRASGLQKVREGQTTVEEVLRETVL